MRENESGTPLCNIEIVEKKNLYGFNTKSDMQNYLKICGVFLSCHGTKVATRADVVLAVLSSLSCIQKLLKYFNLLKTLNWLRNLAGMNSYNQKRFNFYWLIVYLVSC